MKNKIKQNFYIRDFTSEDFNQVNEIWELTAMGGKQRGDNLTVINKTLNNGAKLLVLIEKETEKVIGTSWMTHDFRRIYLHHFGIHPEHQRLGLGEFLAETSIQFAKEQKMQIKLEVHKDNIAAIKLYEKIGFNYLGDYFVYIIRDVESIH
jgi:[ribosomal protein S18]-alanine N-acetyltransferase